MAMTGERVRFADAEAWGMRLLRFALLFWGGSLVGAGLFFLIVWVLF